MRSAMIRYLIFGLACVLFSAGNGYSQGRVIINGGVINISNGAYLVVANPATNAITRTTGSIVSEGANNLIKWNIGTTSGTYTIPWSYAGIYIPVTFTTSAATGAGHVLFSTYHGAPNSAHLPPGVTNFNRASGGNNSPYALDRFWRIDAQDYTVKPTLTNLIFSYQDGEHAAPGNTIIESGLYAQRWNPLLSTWTDLNPASTLNTTTNQLTIPSLNASNFYPWWVITYLAERHWVASSNSTWSGGSNWAFTAGGAPGALVPVSIDHVYFDDVVDNNVSIDVPATMTGLTLASGYAGTLTQNNNTITVSSDATLAGGIFAGGSAAMRINGQFSITGTTFTSTSDTLDVKGNFTRTGGSFTHNNGTVKFSGTTTQQINSITPTNFKNITMSNRTAGTGVSLQNSQNIFGILTLRSNVVFDADGSNNSVLTLRSTADHPVADAAVDILPAGAAITGNITVQRFMTLEGRGGHRIYRYIASPIQNASVADIQNEIPITGSFPQTTVCSTCDVNPSMFFYDESVITDVNGSGAANIDDGYVEFPDVSNTETLQPGRGYALFVRGNIIPSGLWDVRGTLTQGNVTPVALPVSFTSSGVAANDGWNLVGNPFASVIDWNAASGWTKTNIDATLYIHDNGVTPYRFATWNGVTGTNGGSRYIASGQGFWVKASAATPTLLAAENVKASANSAIFFKEPSTDDLMRVVLSKGAVTDEAVIHFREDATSGFDPHADAWKLPNELLNISTRSNDGDYLAINSLPLLRCEASVALSVKSVVAGTHILEFKNLSSFPGDSHFTLRDAFQGTLTEVINDGTYSFQVTSDPASFGDNRFQISIVRPVNAIVITASDGRLTIPEKKGIQWYFNENLIEGATTPELIPDRTGTYSVVVEDDGCARTGSLAFVVTGEESPLLSSLSIFPNPVTDEIFLQSSDQGITAVSITDNLGRTIGSMPLTSYDGVLAGSFKFGENASGVYFIKVVSDHETVIVKVVKK